MTMMSGFILLGAIASMVILATASTLTPPVLPLMVRNPYLSAWLAHAREPPWENWPEFYTGQTLGMSILSMVPGTGTVYPLLGRGHLSLKSSESIYDISFPHYKGATFDASTTNLTYCISLAGGEKTSTQIVLSFLSPITPTSTLRQSIPASYLTIHVYGNLDVSIYADITGEWISGDTDTAIEWQFVNSTSSPYDPKNSLKIFKVRRVEEHVFNEINDRAEWGTLHFTGPSNVHHQAGAADELRRQFAATGQLRDEIENSSREISDDWPAFAFSKSFELNRSNTRNIGDSVTFSIAYTQDSVVQYASARGLTFMRPFWASIFHDEATLIRFHYFDFPEANRLASNYSNQLAADALKSGSEDYRDIVALSARQVLGATSFSGTPENPLIFLKEISSNGDSQTVDVIFPAFPFFLYTNPKWLGYLLEPLIEHQLSGQYPNKYTMHDMGTFPNVTGYPDGKDEYMPVEECGNMLIMGLALVNALKSGEEPASVRTAYGAGNEYDPLTSSAFPLYVDTHGFDVSLSDPNNGKGAKQGQKWLHRSYRLWKQWTGYLVRETLIPKNQLSTDDFAGWLANQTNLALKGIIGIRAMSELASTIGEHEDARYYRNISESYIEKWQEYGISRDGTHTKLSYTWYGSWSMLYNLYADALLCFHLPSSRTKPAAGGHQEPLLDTVEVKTPFVDKRVYKMQSTWYHNVRQKYGLPLDSRHVYTKSDWEFFTIAVTSTAVREEIMQSIARWVNETTTDRPLTDLYETEGSGDFPDGIYFKARPVVGGHFSFLALERACDGKAVAGLAFLNEKEEEDLSVEELLEADTKI